MSTEIYVINPQLKTIESKILTRGLEEVKQIIGFDTIETDNLDDQGHTLYFDENCFLKGTKDLGRFQIDTLAPVAGIGVIVKRQSNHPLIFETPSISLDNLKSRIQFT
jgi:hypothetical protein